MKVLRSILFFLFVLLSMQNVSAQSVSEPDSVLHISFLTSAPGPDIHEAYGHTAIRVRMSGTDYDWSFNYGVFTYEENNFFWHFILGKAEFMCCAFPSDIYLEVYAKEGRWVDEQEINLTDEEKYELLRLLEANVMNKGWKYQYSFLYDNCTTRSYEKIFEAIIGKIVSPEEDNSKTFRELLHEFSGPNEWSGFAADLVLGNEVEQVPSTQQMMFLPLYAEAILDKTKIENPDGSVRPFVKSKVRHEPFFKGDRNLFPFRPIHFAILLLIFTVMLTVFEYVKKKYVKWFDVLLMFCQGVIGIIVMILLLFSHHPAVSSNWNALWLNILPLFALVFSFLKNKMELLLGVFAMIIVLLLTFFIIGTVGVQDIPFAAYILALTLLIRYSNALLNTYKHSRTNCSYTNNSIS